MSGLVRLIDRSVCYGATEGVGLPVKCECVCSDLEPFVNGYIYEFCRLSMSGSCDCVIEKFGVVVTLQTLFERYALRSPLEHSLS